MEEIHLYIDTVVQLTEIAKNLYAICQIYRTGGEEKKR